MAWTDAGTLAYVPGDVRGGMRQLAFVDLKGAIQTVGLQPGLYNDIRMSPDGSRVAVAQGSSGVADIWVYTFARGTYTRLTFTGVNATPVWSADGRDIFFSAMQRSGRGTSFFRTSADGGRSGGRRVIGVSRVLEARQPRREVGARGLHHRRGEPRERRAAGAEARRRGRASGRHAEPASAISRTATAAGC